MASSRASRWTHADVRMSFHFGQIGQILGAATRSVRGIRLNARFEKGQAQTVGEIMYGTAPV